MRVRSCACGWAGRATASYLFGGTPRKVRAPQGKVVGNTHPGQPAGQCHREQTATRLRPGGKGETVVQETTSDPGDRVGSVNPTWSKVRQCAFEGGSPEHAGRPLEAIGNGRPRWMVAHRDPCEGPEDRTRPTGQPVRRTGSDLSAVTTPPWSADGPHENSSCGRHRGAARPHRPGHRAPALHHPRGRPDRGRRRRRHRRARQPRELLERSGRYAALHPAWPTGEIAAAHPAQR